MLVIMGLYQLDYKAIELLFITGSRIALPIRSGMSYILLIIVIMILNKNLVEEVTLLPVLIEKLFCNEFLNVLFFFLFKFLFPPFLRLQYWQPLGQLTFLIK